MTGLYHSAKGTTWDKHKYTDRVIKNGKVVYIYDEKAVAKDQLIEKARVDMKAAGLPSFAIEGVEKYLSTVGNIYDYINAKNITSDEDLKKALTKLIEDSGVKHLSSSDMDTLLKVAKKSANGETLTKNDYFDIAEVTAKTNLKDIQKINTTVRESREYLPNRKTYEQMIALKKPSTENVTFGKKIYNKLKETCNVASEKLSDLSTDLKVKGIRFVRKLFG